MIGRYLTQKANNTKKFVLNTSYILIACGSGYVTYRVVSALKDRMLGLGMGAVVSYVTYRKIS